MIKAIKKVPQFVIEKDLRNQMILAKIKSLSNQIQQKKTILFRVHIN